MARTTGQVCSIPDHPLARFEETRQIPSTGQPERALPALRVLTILVGIEVLLVSLMS